jgi:hypothetical protein
MLHRHLAAFAFIFVAAVSAHVRAQEPGDEAPVAPPDACAIDGFAAGGRLVQDEVIAQWTNEAQALAPFGAPANFDLDAVDLHVTFDSAATLASTANVTSLPGNSAFTWTFADVVIDGVGSGRLDVVGAVTVLGATVSAASVTSAEVTAGAVTVRVAPDALATSFAGATLSGYDSATLVDAAGVATTLGTSVTLASAGALTCNTGLLTLGVDALALSSGAFALAGDFTAGTVLVEGEASSPVQVRTLIGTSGEFVVDGAGVAGSARVTQVFDDNAPLLQADVEIVVLAPVAVVSPGGSVNVPALVRNRSARAQAILTGIEVDGCAAAAVKPVVDETPPLLVGILIESIENTGWAAPFVAITLAPLLGVALLADGFLIVADAFADAFGDIFCGIFGCDEEEPPPAPVPPIPYPKWLEPGQVAGFEIALLAPDLVVDDYPVRVRFLGNHPTAHVDFTLRVGRGDVPSNWQCGVEQWGSADGCHCGCGARDSDCPGGATIESCDVDACSPGFNHLEPSDIDVCVPDDVPPPVDTGDDDDDDDSDDPFGCTSTSAATAAPWFAGCVVAFALRRRVRTQRRGV